MKKLSRILSGIILLAAACTSPAPAPNLETGQIYLFYRNGCPYCEAAENFIAANYPGLPLRKINVATFPGRRLYFRCVEKFNLNQEHLGTPLICTDNTYILGWSEQAAYQFGRSVRPYLHYDYIQRLGTEYP